MKALHYPAFDTLRIAEVALSPPQPGEVTLKIAACGLCGSELESFKSRSERRPPPLVMGHEFCGEVVGVGERVTGDFIGGRFVSNSVVPCGRCRRCGRGDTHLCADRQIFGMHRAGAFAEYVNVPAHVLLPWPEELPARAACLAEPLANGVHVVGLTLHLSAGKVLVIGAGPIGLMVQQAVRELRGSEVMVCDLSAGRLEIAARLGAARTVDSRRRDPAAEALAWTDGEGVDLVVDAAGSAVTKRLSLAALRPGGAAVWIGLHEDAVELGTHAITLPEKQVLGTYAAKQHELAEAVELMRSGRVDATSWTECVPLEESVEVFQRMLCPSDADLKAVFVP